MKPINLAELKAASDLACRIENKLTELKRAEGVLADVNKFGKSGQVWKPELIVKERSGSWSNDQVTIRVPIPFGVIQQSALDEVKRIKRELVLMGYLP